MRESKMDKEAQEKLIQRLDDLERKVWILENEVFFYKVMVLRPAAKSYWRQGIASEARASIYTTLSRTYGLGEVVVSLINSGKLSIEEVPAAPAKLTVSLCAPVDPAPRV